VGFIDQIIHNPNPNNNETWNSYEDIAVVFYRLGSSFIDKHFTMSFVRGYPGDYNKEFLIMIWDFNGYASLDLLNLPRNPNIDTITVNNTLYHGVYMGINQMNNAEDSVAKNMFYDKQKGWLRFELKSGETYDRIN
jgi:hypothetical protein